VLTTNNTALFQKGLGRRGILLTHLRGAFLWDPDTQRELQNGGKWGFGCWMGLGIERRDLSRIKWAGG
jgi:hypothetical protein